MSRFKIPLILFGSVFVVSFVLAFVGGSSYFSLVKAFLSAVVATAFFFGAKFLLGKYIPDLFEAKDDSSDASHLGGSVDIRIQEEGSTVGGAGGGTLANAIDIDLSEKKGVSPYADLAHPVSLNDGLSSLEGLSLEEPSFDDDKKDANKKEGFEPLPPPPNVTTTEEDVVNNKKVEQKSHSSSAPLSSENSEKPSADVSSNSSESSDATREKSAEEASESSNIDSIVEEELTQAVEQDVDRLEELPDLQEFVDTSHSEGQSRGEELMNTGTQSFFETDLSENVTDTNLMTSAIRTMLRRKS